MIFDRGVGLRCIWRSGANVEMSWWTLRRLARFVLGVVRLCATYRLASSPVRPGLAGSGSGAMSKAQSSRRQLPSLLELSQPESWHQLHRDIQQRLQQGRLSSQSPLLPGDGGPSGSREHGSCEPHTPVLPEAVRDTLSSPPWTRTHRQVEQAVVELKKACSDFRDYPAPVQHSLCKVGWHLSLDQGRVIFREHSPASCFYLIVSGSVLVTSEQEPAHSLAAGTSFGDESIVDKCPRTTTCSALTHVELLVISKSDFLDLSLRQSRISYQKTKHLSFCKSVSLLSHWPLHLLEVHPDQCKVAFFKTNSVVVKDSMRNQWVYIIMSGSCRVVKRFVYGSEDQSEKTQKRKSYSNPSDISKLALTGESAASRYQSLGILRQQMLSTQKKSKQPLPQGGGAMDQGQKKGHRLPHTISTPQISERQHLPKKQFLLQLQLLKPKDTFGLSSFVYEDEPSVTLVSNGAEVVMLSKEFLHQHFNETIRTKLKRQITQFPSQETMLKRIREHYS